MRGRELDEAVLRRLTEMMSAAGVDSARASLEVLYLLPRDFLTTYAELFETALKLGGSSGSGGGDEGELQKGPAGRAADRGKKPMLSSGGGKRYKEHWVVRNDEALDLKHRVDKRLRGLGRELKEELLEGLRSREAGGARGNRVRCVRCGRMMKRDDNFCSSCGNHRPVGGD